MDLSGKRVVVVGLGRSGLAAVRLCASRGAQVIGNDSRPELELPADLQRLGVEVVLGGHQPARLSEADLVVVSPGVPPLVELSHAERAGVPVIGELELGARFVPQGVPVLAVGGTNGKSTTTTLLSSMLAESGLRTFAGGNLGVPLCEVVDEQWDALVLEVSSFQLERVPSFRPRVSILLNVSEDHLDRYQDFDAYARAKGNAFAHQQPSDFAVLPHADPLTHEVAGRGEAATLTFGIQGGDYRLRGRVIEERSSGVRFDVADAQLHGGHNLLNAAAAIAAARQVGATPDGIARALAAFEGLPHRMNLAGRVTGIPFYDDSKATNVGAAVTALRGLQEARAVLIAGGRDKHGSYEPLVQGLLEKGRGLVVIGEASERLVGALRASSDPRAQALPVVAAASLNEAVTAAWQLARAGDAVLLSPACSSFDQFHSYAERGERFCEAVSALAAAPTS